jgi:membrane protease YdiL (CAAX protease family)
MFLKRHPLLSYFVLAYLLTWIIEVPLMLDTRGVLSLHLPSWMEALAAFGPFVAALIVLGVWQGEAGLRQLFESLFRWQVSGIWWLVTLIFPFVIMLAALAITGAADRLFSGELLRGLWVEGRLFEVVLLGGVLRGLGEEPGWRGLALPVLRRLHSPLIATLLLWPVWACWHLPSFLMRPEFALGAWFGFSLGILAATVFLTFLYDQTRSVLLAVIWHALINIARTIAGAASQDAFFAFAQLMMLTGTVIILYWIFTGRNAQV